MRKRWKIVTILEGIAQPVNEWDTFWTLRGAKKEEFRSYLENHNEGFPRSSIYYVIERNV